MNIEIAKSKNQEIKFLSDESDVKNLIKNKINSKENELEKVQKRDIKKGKENNEIKNQISITHRNIQKLDHNYINNEKELKRALKDISYKIKFLFEEIRAKNLKNLIILFSKAKQIKRYKSKELENKTEINTLSQLKQQEEVELIPNFEMTKIFENVPKLTININSLESIQKGEIKILSNNLFEISESSINSPDKYLFNLSNILKNKVFKQFYNFKEIENKSFNLEISLGWKDNDIHFENALKCLEKFHKMKNVLFMHNKLRNEFLMYSLKNQNLHIIFIHFCKRFLKRNIHSYLFNSICNRRKSNKIKFSEINIVKMINSFKRNKKQIESINIFKNSTFRNSGRSLAFERKKLNSPYLFYLKKGSPMFINIQHLILNNIYKIALYHQLNINDFEEHKGFIFACGGGDEKSLSTCWKIEMSNKNVLLGNAITNLIFPRIHSCLVTSPFGLYIIGGINSYGSMKSCERLYNRDAWERMPDLHNSSCFVTSSYIGNGFIYIFGSSISNYERLFLKDSKIGKWELLNMKLANSSRRFGCIIQLSDQQILILGGANSSKKIIKFNLDKNSVEETTIAFNRYYYSGSRLRILGSKLHLVSGSNHKRILIDMSNNFEWAEMDINF